MEIKYRTQLGELCEHLGMLGYAAEIGVAEGNFSKDLLNMGFERLYMVDNWATIEGVKGDGNFGQEWHDKNLSRAKEQTEPFFDKVVILRGMSSKMCELVPDESLGLVYLDAGHDYSSVWFDLKHWYPKLKKGGIMAGHDFVNTAYGVAEAVHDFTSKRGIEVHLIAEDKNEDAGFWFIKC